jgi:hypothetical protein
MLIFGGKNNPSPIPLLIINKKGDKRMERVG